MDEERLHFPISSHPELETMIKRNHLILGAMDHKHRHFYLFNPTYIRERVPWECESPVEDYSEDGSEC